MPSKREKRAERRKEREESDRESVEAMRSYWRYYVLNGEPSSYHFSSAVAPVHSVPNRPQYSTHYSPQSSPQYSQIGEVMKLFELEHEQLQNELHQENEEESSSNIPQTFRKEKKPAAFEPKSIVECPIPSPPIEPIALLKAATVQKIIKVEIPSPPTQNVVTLKPHTPQKIKEMRIPSPPIKQVVTLKAPTPYKAKEMRIPSPPVQEVVLLEPFPVQRIVTATVPSQETLIQTVVSLKPFPAQRIVSTSVPSLETPIQSVVTLQPAPVHRVVEMSVPSQNTPVQQIVKLQVAPVHRIVETQIPTVPIQQIVSLQLTPPMKLIESPVTPHTESVSKLSFFWDPKVEIANESDENVLLPNKNVSSPLEVLESELSFLWIPQEVNENVAKCAFKQSSEFTLLISNPITTCNVLSVPSVPTVTIQNVPTILVSTVHQPSPICDAFLTILITLVYIVPPLISQTKNTTSPPHFKETRQFLTHKTKIISPQKKPQFSGSCVIKSRQLRRKGKRVRRQFAMEKSSFRSFRSLKDSSRSWKHRKKKRHRIMSLKSISDQSSPLKKVATWKRRKKKCFLTASLELSHIGKGPSLRKIHSWKFRKKKLAHKESLLRETVAWKRRKKKCCSRKWLFSVFDWDPDAAFHGVSRQVFIHSSFPVPACFCLSSSFSALSRRGKEM